MTKTNFIQVFEYQKLKIGENGFNENHLNALVKYNEKNGNKYFTPVYNGILFNSYVGVIHISGITIEILPKADKADMPNKNLWQKVLLNMLKVCKHIQVDTVSETGLKKKNNSILDVYFEIYLNEVEQLVQQGLIKKYRRIRGNKSVLKGKLLFNENIQKNLVHKEKFFCEYQVYDKDHTIHQVLYKGLRILKNITTHHLNDKTERLLFHFDDFTSNENFHFEKIKLDRKSIVYKKALEVAKMLILNYSPNLNSGKQQMITLLFDMNKLWEEYVYQVLSRHIDNSQYEISAQSSDYFWEHKTIRPDIVIFDKINNNTYVIDTKWKIVENNNPADEDLKQMFTYNLHWKAEKSILLYPKVHYEDSDFGKFHFKPNHGNRDTDFGNMCKIGFVSIIGGHGIKDAMEISSTILQKFF